MTFIGTSYPARLLENTDKLKLGADAKFLFEWLSVVSECRSLQVQTPGTSLTRFETSIIDY